MFCHTCIQAFQQGNASLVSKKDTFLSFGYTNWKDATGEKSGGFPTHERSEVSHSSRSPLYVAILASYILFSSYM